MVELQRKHLYLLLLQLTTQLQLVLLVVVVATHREVMVATRCLQQSHLSVAAVVVIAKEITIHQVLTVALAVEVDAVKEPLAVVLEQLFKVSLGHLVYSKAAEAVEELVQPQET